MASGSQFTAPLGAFVYAVGRLVPQFQSLDVEKEFAQLAAQSDRTEASEHEQLKAVLEDPENLFLAHHICWTFSTGGLDSFAVVPRDDVDARRLVDAFAPASEEAVINACVGRPATTPPLWDWTTTGLRLIHADQLLTFTLDEFLEALDRTDDGDGEGGARRSAMRDLFLRLTRRSDNQGVADGSRAMNYLALRYPSVYRATIEALDGGNQLMGVEARPAAAADRRLVSVRLVFRNPQTQIVERYGCSVDVTGEFCFLSAPLSPTYD
jgi:hypothetical protein